MRPLRQLAARPSLVEVRSAEALRSRAPQFRDRRQLLLQLRLQLPSRLSAQLRGLSIRRQPNRRAQSPLLSQIHAQRHARHRHRYPDVAQLGVCRQLRLQLLHAAALLNHGSQRPGLVKAGILQRYEHLCVHMMEGRRALDSAAAPQDPARQRAALRSKPAVQQRQQSLSCSRALGRSIRSRGRLSVAPLTRS